MGTFFDRANIAQEHFGHFGANFQKHCSETLAIIDVIGKCYRLLNDCSDFVH